MHGPAPDTSYSFQKLEWRTWAPIIGEWSWWAVRLSLSLSPPGSEEGRKREKEREGKHVTENKNRTCSGYISASSTFNWLATKPEAKKKKKKKKKEEKR